MKIKAWQLEKTISDSLSSVYIISGEEPFQKEEICQIIRKKAYADGFIEKITYHADNQFNWQLIEEAASSLSLFSTKQVVELRLLSDTKITAQAELALSFYASNIPVDTLLIIVSDKINKMTERSTWFKRFEQAGVWIPVWPIEGLQLIKWLSTRMQRVGLKPAQEALTLLAERCEGNLLAASQEIEKLTMMTSEKKITLKHVRVLVANSAHYDGFVLCEAIISGNARHAVQIYRGLCAEGVELSRLLWLLARELRILSQLTKLLKSGVKLDASIKQVSSDQRLPFFSLKRRSHEYLGCVNRLGEKTVNYLIDQAFSLDNLLKTGLDSCTSDQLLTLIVVMSGVKQASNIII